MHELPKTENLKISTLEEAADIIKLLILKINEMEDREPIRDQGLVEEIIHLRTEMNAGFVGLRTEMNTRFVELEGKVDENTLAIKSLGGKFDQMHETMKSMETEMKGMGDQMKGMGDQMKGGFDNVGKILQEISNKLDK